MMHFFRSISQGLKTADGASAHTAQAREARAQRLATLTYDDVLREQAIFGTLEMVADRLSSCARRSASRAFRRG